MKDHFRAFSAVFPIILKRTDGKTYILLHKRANTGYMDGKWDTAGSGHVDKCETATHALARECFEELGITVDPQKLRFAHLAHNVEDNGDETYYNVYFFVDEFEGIPQIKEPNKCDGLEWFDVTSLPENMIEKRKNDVLQSLQSIYYSELIEE